MSVVLVSCKACGLYSGNTYEEYVFLPNALFSAIQLQIPTEIYIGALDGKYSCVSAKVSCCSNPETADEFSLWDYRSDGNILRERLKDIVSKIPLTIDFEAELCRAKEYLKSIDPVVQVNVRVRRSNISNIQKIAAQMR